ncbi:hypothetical protein GCE86_15010 [Micromonospora terminaliae]|uniref:Uncharacterized protein n=1 Tax=Micromonospora terminaliae TaxID=1914461 RepID=A0ABX6E6M6_9ACTN|nr:hypothetical protein GCE86_15010 [Micromonospora terminaliae]
MERLGFGRQVFERIAAVRAAGGDVAGPGVRIDAYGMVVAARRSASRCEGDSDAASALTFPCTGKFQSGTR